MFAIRGSLPLNFEGAYVSHGKTLSWMCNNTKKMKPSAVAKTDSSPISSMKSGVEQDFMDSVDSFPAASFSTSVPSQKKTGQAPPPGAFSYAAAAATNKINTKTTIPVASSKGATAILMGSFSFLLIYFN